jgi:endoglucanase
MSFSKHDNALVYAGTLFLLLIMLGMFVYSLRQNLPVFSERGLLEATWHYYKQDYLEPGTLRALDKQRDNITTSEGQSYTLLRAVWMDDKDTFDTAWQWTKDNLRRPDDNLFSWLFGQRADGSYGILTDQGGENTATDADSDIALALLFASKRWNDDSYFGDAILIIRDIWDKEVLVLNGQPYLLANNVEKTSGRPAALINPSYLSPYAYKIFSEVDPGHDWMGLVDSSYDLLEAVSEAPLDKPTSANIPPDWVDIQRLDQSLSVPTTGQNLTTNYSYDALRTPWRIALDAVWFDDPRAYRYLERLQFLSLEWARAHELASTYAHDGSPLARDQSHAIYGGAIGYYTLIQPEQGREVYTDKLEALYDSSSFQWKQPLSYYDANWVWFGIALYHDELPNLYSRRMYD